MNLFLLAVWCGVLLSYTVSLPSRRQTKYPVTQIQNPYNVRSHPTALEVLERTLLHPQEAEPRHSHQRCESRSLAHYNGESTSPLYYELSIKDKTKDKVDSCIDSFGKQSPLCQPRKRRKKSFVGIPDFHKRLFRSDVEYNKIMAGTTLNPSEDFFGIFKSTGDQTDGSAQYSNESYISKFNTYPSVTKTLSTLANTTFMSSTSPFQNITQEKTLQRNTSDKPTIQPTVSPHINISYNVSVDPTERALKNETSKIILPGSVKKIESQPTFFYLEEVGSKDHFKAGDNMALEETQDGVPEEDAKSNEPSEETTAVTESTRRLTFPPSFESVLPKETHSKSQCELETNKKCICLFSSIRSDFQTIFSQAKNIDEIMAEMVGMKCRKYTAGPSVFDLNANAKPRVLKGKHAPFAVDNRQGAKEVKEESLNEYIAFSAVDDGIMRVFVASNVKIPCFPRPDIHLSASDADHVKHTWTYGTKKHAITEGRITEDKDGDGSLTIDDIQLTDSLNYTCEIDYIHPDTGERTTDTFVHTLSVVTLPIASARAVVHYTSSAACDESLLEMFEMYLPQQVEEVICTTGDVKHLCSVVIHSPVCHSEDQEDAKGAMELSLNYDVFIHRPGTKELPGTRASLCDPDCHLLITFKLLQLFRESVQEIAYVPITSSVKDGGTFTPVPSSVKVKYIFGCIGGYFLQNGFCLACPKGTYSDDGDTECQKCPLHSYSGSVGTRTCTPCKHLWMPVCNEHFEAINIMIIVYVVAGLVLLLACFIVYYFFFYKGQTWQEVLKKGPKEKMARSEKVRFRKELESKRNAKGIRKNEQLSEEDMQRLVQSSGESGNDSEPETYKKEKRAYGKKAKS